MSDLDKIHLVSTDKLEAINPRLRIDTIARINALIKHSHAVICVTLAGIGTHRVKSILPKDAFTVEVLLEDAVLKRDVTVQVPWYTVFALYLAD